MIAPRGIEDRQAQADRNLLRGELSMSPSEPVDRFLSAGRSPAVPRRHRVRLAPAMTTLVCAVSCAIICAIAPITVDSARAQSASAFEAPPVMLATEALPESMVVGPDHRVENFVYNDGSINTYQVTSTFGRAAVRSTALLSLRIEEVRALRRLEQLASSDAYQDASEAAIQGPLREQKRFIAGDPSTGAAPAGGIGTFFGGDATVSGVAGSESVTATSARFDSYKRAFAYAAQLNPYSRFDAVQQNLREFAWNCFAGGLSVEEAFAALAKAPIQPRTVSSFDDVVDVRIRDEAPGRLRERNIEMLTAMGVNEAVARLLQSQTRYTPVAKTVITEALGRMNGVADRQVFVERASLIGETEMAHLIQGWSTLLAGYHENIEPVARMVRVAQVPFLLTGSGKLVGLFAMDLLVWTPETARALGRISDSVARIDGVKARELWFSGRVTPLTRDNLEERGWKVVEEAGPRLQLR